MNKSTYYIKTIKELEELNKASDDLLFITDINKNKRLKK